MIPPQKKKNEQPEEESPRDAIRQNDGRLKENSSLLLSMDLVTGFVYFPASVFEAKNELRGRQFSHFSSFRATDGVLLFGSCSLLFPVPLLRVSLKLALFRFH